MRKKSASGVLASLRGSTYGLGKRLFTQAMGRRVNKVYDSPLCSLRPCWTSLFEHPAWLFVVISHIANCDGFSSRKGFPAGC